MGLFGKRTTESEWLREFSPAVNQCSKLKSEASDVLLTLSTDISPMSLQLDKLRLVAQQIKRLPSPTSSVAARAKRGYDSMLNAEIDKLQVQAQMMVYVNGHRQQSVINLRERRPSSLTSGELNRAEKMAAEKGRLEETILEKKWDIRDYFGDNNLPLD